MLPARRKIASASGEHGIARMCRQVHYAQMGSANPEIFGLERETGLEPATPCLEGRYSTN